MSEKGVSWAASDSIEVGASSTCVVAPARTSVEVIAISMYT